MRLRGQCSLCIQNTVSGTRELEQSLDDSGTTFTVLCGVKAMLQSKLAGVVIVQLYMWLVGESLHGRYERGCNRACAQIAASALA